MRIIYFTAPVQDYLSDSILIGLKSLEGISVDDYPNNQFIYKDEKFEVAKSKMYGNGFTLYNLLNDGLRTDFRFKQLDFSEYDLFIFSAIEHQYGLFLQLREYLHAHNTIILDGSDSGNLFPNAGKFWRNVYSLFYPKLYNYYPYYKREINVETRQSRFYKILPTFITSFIKDPLYLKLISFCFPSEKIISILPLKKKTFATHIVDKEVAAAIGSLQTYSFNREVDYYKDLQESKFGITTKRAGWDCMRHYEIAANGAVICFRDLESKPFDCAPHGLRPGYNCLSYNSYANLTEQVNNLGEQDYALMQQRSIEWVKSKSTISVSTDLLQSFLPTFKRGLTNVAQTKIEN